jgi:hypothetical protein
MHKILAMSFKTLTLLCEPELKMSRPSTIGAQWGQEVEDRAWNQLFANTGRR